MPALTSIPIDRTPGTQCVTASEAIAAAHRAGIPLRQPDPFKLDLIDLNGQAIVWQVSGDRLMLFSNVSPPRY